MIRNKTNFKYCVWGLSLVISLLVFSCKSKQEAGSVKMIKRSDSELISAVLSNTVEYNKFSAKLNVNLQPGQKNKGISAPASLKIIKGEALMLSFQMPIFNFEMFKMVITPDSILLIDRKNKMYVMEAIRDVKEVADFAFEYQNLEALFTNQMFIAGKTEITPGDYKQFKVDQEPYVAHISSKDRRGITYAFTSDYTDRVCKTEIESSGKSTRMIWSYDHFVLLQDNKIFPVKMEMVLN
ncbi:MAG: DUF4292 domain-containing protein, partial [Dysgonamonadaceae bacterium]|nr:DUF4292 domain-containing protein [Dysgonamonadaceae bacterium]